MKRFFIAHVRTPDYEKLRKKGFLVLYPDVDDYVFLEDTPGNQKLLRKQTEIGVYFLRKGETYQTVSQAEIDRMKKTTADQLTVGSAITVVSGYCENLDGRVDQIEGDRVKVTLDGFNRKYEVELDRLEVSVKQDT